MLHTVGAVTMGTVSVTIVLFLVLLSNVELFAVLGQSDENICKYRTTQPETYSVLLSSEWCWSWFYRQYYICNERYGQRTHYVSTIVLNCCPGWTDVSNCLEKCTSGYYGYQCEQKCNCPMEGVTCHHMDGSCTDLCDPVCLDNQRCNPENMSCKCMTGWQGNKCTLPCKMGWHGDDCHTPCNCVNAVMCDNVDGRCTCKAGWTGPHCNETCDGRLYGIRCEENCSCPSNATCDPVNGTCSCSPGFHGERCHQTCPHGFYDVNCMSICPCEINQTCNPVTGECDVPLADTKSTEDNMQTLALGVGISALVFVLIILAIVLWKIRRKDTINDNKESLQPNQTDPEQTGNCLYSSVDPSLPHSPWYNTLETNDEYDKLQNLETVAPSVDHSYEEAAAPKLMNSHRQDTQPNDGYDELRQEGTYHPSENRYDSLSGLPSGDETHGYCDLEMEPTNENEDLTYNISPIENQSESSTTDDISKAVVPGSVAHIYNQVEMSESGNYEEHLNSYQNETPCDDEYSTINRNAYMPRGSDKKTDDDDAGYGVLTTTADFNESDEEYDTLRNIKSPDVHHDNTYNSLKL